MVDKTPEFLKYPLEEFKKSFFQESLAKGKRFRIVAFDVNESYGAYSVISHFMKMFGTNTHIVDATWVLDMPPSSSHIFLLNIREVLFFAVEKGFLEEELTPLAAKIKFGFDLYDNLWEGAVE